MKGGIVVLWAWIVAIVLFVVVEALTVQLVTIWFAAGAVGGLIACLFKLPLWAQIAIFVAVSLVALIVTRPLVKRFNSSKKLATNVDRNIGEVAIVTESIDNEYSQGAVKIGGLEWTARSSDGEKIEKDEKVIVEAVEGVKLMVRRK